MHRGIATFFSILTLWVSGVITTHAQDSHVSASLVSEVESAQPGSTFWVALYQEMEPHWHTYYKDPGDSGLPTEIEWTLPAGVTAGAIHWPEPEEYVQGSIVSNVYGEHVLLMVPITVAEDFSASELTLQAEATWLECKEICLPGSASVSLSLPVKDAPPAYNDWKNRFDETRQQWDAESRKSLNPSVSSTNTAPASTAPKSSESLIMLLGIGLIGGLILNLMPCVFPVIGLKIMGFVHQAGEDRAHIVKHGLIFTLGVLVSFWTLAGIFLSLREAGESVGWGFQMQNPDVVVALGFIFLLVAANMYGLFEIGGSAVGVGGSLAGKQGNVGTFFSGVLATVAATPCSAPFLVTALGATLHQPVFPTLLIFTSIALGLSLPYLLLSLFPSAVKKLPKPGAWMESLKQGLSFLLVATTAFIVWVAAGMLSEIRLRDFLLGLSLSVAAAWVWGRWGQQRTGRAKRIGQVIALALFVLGLFLAYRPHTDFWETWSPERVEELRAEGRPVYIDFTARWCVTCQSNKEVVFSSDAVLERFEEMNVAALKADFTQRNPQIARAMAQYGRNAVPVNVIYLPDASDPIVLPPVLTPDTVLKALEDSPKN